MNAVLTKSHAQNRFEVKLAHGAHLKRVRDEGLANAIGGFTEWIALCGYTRQHAERLIALAERVGR